MSTLQVDAALQGAVSHIAPCAADLLEQRAATPAGRAAAAAEAAYADATHTTFCELLQRACASFSAFIIAVHAVSEGSRGRRVACA